MRHRCPLVAHLLYEFTVAILDLLHFS